MKLLIDECLSPSLAAAARARGIEADAVAYVGKSGWQDHNLASFAIANDYVIVTNNRRDYLRLYSGVELHPGLVIIVPRVSRERARELFGLVLDRLAGGGSDTVNRVVEVLATGEVNMGSWCGSERDIGRIGVSPG